MKRVATGNYMAFFFNFNAQVTYIEYYSSVVNNAGISKIFLYLKTSNINFASLFSSTILSLTLYAHKHVIVGIVA